MKTLSGFAALLCGKAVPFRQDLFLTIRQGYALPSSRRSLE
jgi:hypothetical protein